MAYEQRENTGSIFKNDKKETDKQPDYKGQALIGGVEYWVAAWMKTGASGVKFMSFSYTPKDENKSDGFESQKPDDKLAQLPF